MKESISKSVLASRHPRLQQRILVVEDDRDIRRLNSEVLTQAGYQVNTATDGATAWESLRLEHYDLVVIDNEVPDLSGIELIEKIHNAGMRLPIIMASRTPATWELTHDPRLQPDATITMPYTTAEFLGKVEEILNSSNVPLEQQELDLGSPELVRLNGSRNRML